MGPPFIRMAAPTELEASQRSGERVTITIPRLQMTILRQGEAQRVEDVVRT